MSELLEEIRLQFGKELRNCSSEREIEEIRVKYLGRKKGLLTEAFKRIGTLPQAQRGAFGQEANALKAEISGELEARAKGFASGEIPRERVDVTLPAPAPRIGRRHPVSVVRRRITAIFTELGYRIADGPQIETDYYNFQALNMPPNHPARDTQDTFYLPNDLLLRTHTSPVQIREMESERPPIKIIIPGRVYRPDYDITHTPMFLQVEGLVVDKGITFGDLKGTLDYYSKRMYGEKTRTRFRPSFFPFTEPSAEVDISCPFCGSKGCRVCKNSGWIEIMGAGMVDPAVFGHVGIDPLEYSGFAFGMGIGRQAMLLFGLDDARALFENDASMLEQIGGWP